MRYIYIERNSDNYCTTIKCCAKGAFSVQTSHSDIKTYFIWQYSTSIYHNVLWSTPYKCYQIVYVCHLLLTTDYLCIGSGCWRYGDALVSGSDLQCRVKWGSNIISLYRDLLQILLTSWSRENQMLFEIIKYVSMLRFNAWIIKYTLKCYSLKISAYNKVSLVWLSYSQKQTWN